MNIIISSCVLADSQTVIHVCRFFHGAHPFAQIRGPLLGPTQQCVNSYCTQMLFPGEVGSRLWQGFIYRHLLYHGVIDRPPGIQRNIPDDMAPHKPTDSHSNQHMQITEHMFQPLALCLQECVNGNVVATNPKSTRLQTT